MREKVYDCAMLDLTNARQGAHAIGPLAVLSAAALSIAATSIWSRNVGDTSCGWRVDYSPNGRAFGIWGLLYTGTFAVCVIQTTGSVPVFDWWVHFLWALSWLSCTFWVPLFDAESPASLSWACVKILLAALSGTAAVWVAAMWTGEESRWGRVGLGCPLTLLAGWLLTASSINVGIVYKATRPGARVSCVKVPPRQQHESHSQYRERRRALYRKQYASAPLRVSFVPVVLAVGVAALSVGASDPLLAAPLAWAIVNLKGFPCVEYVAALVVCASGAAACCTRLLADS
jgi:hypothetical protein